MNTPLTLSSNPRIAACSTTVAVKSMETALPGRSVSIAVTVIVAMPAPSGVSSTIVASAEIATDTKVRSDDLTT